MKPTDEAKRLSYEIADEYLPDVNILGVDGPNTGLADEIISKVLDAVSKKTEPLERVSARLKAGDLDEWSHKAADGIICSVLQNIKTLRP